MSESTLIKFLLISSLLILALVFLIVIVRGLLNFIIYLSSNKILKVNKALDNNSYSKKNFIKEDEELIKYKNEIPQAHSKVKADKIAYNNQKQYQIINDQQHEEQEYIVGIVEPVGFWTRKIFGQRIATILAQVESYKKGESTKFWQNFVKASRQQAQSQNRQNYFK